MKRSLPRVLALMLALTLIMKVSPALSDERLPDVRLLIDVSGSMRESDPNNLRQPALDLMLRLLPENSRAGVWTFGQRVNMPVKHRQVDQQWREDAAEAVAGINNNGLYTNIPDVLELATFDAQRLQYQYRTSVILLTDGKVDISDREGVNERAARDILLKHAIELRDLGVQVHTIALSDDADWEFLQELAQTTGGLAAKAESAEALTAVFLQALDIAAPTEQVPMLGGEFLIDDTVREFTVLVFPEDDDTVITLVTPAGETIVAETAQGSRSWFAGRGFALITVREPAAGTWRVKAPAAITRVNVMSQLSLQVEGLDTSLPAGHQPEIGISLHDQGIPVIEAELLEVLDINVSVVSSSGERWQLKPEPGLIPSNGEFSVALPMLGEAGRYEILVTLDGGSFLRELSLLSDVYAPEPPPMPTISVPEPKPATPQNWLIPAAVGCLLFAVLAWWFYSRRRVEED